MSSLRFNQMGKFLGDGRSVFKAFNIRETYNNYYISCDTPTYCFLEPQQDQIF